MPSRILIIDDAPANIQTLSTILKERGYNLNIATNGLRPVRRLTSTSTISATTVSLR